jgi:L-amino acid N-acyltransferase YncA
VSSRPVYRGVADASVYVAAADRSRGVWRDVLLLERRSARVD